MINGKVELKVWARLEKFGMLAWRFCGCSVSNAASGKKSTSNSYLDKREDFKNKEKKVFSSSSESEEVKDNIKGKERI
jgi:hypothetical protein